MIALATPGTSAVPLIPVAGDKIADEPDRLQCGQHREFEAPAATGSNRCTAANQAPLVNGPQRSTRVSMRSSPMGAIHTANKIAAHP